MTFAKKCYLIICCVWSLEISLASVEAFLVLHGKGVHSGGGTVCSFPALLLSTTLAAFWFKYVLPHP